MVRISALKKERLHLNNKLGSKKTGHDVDYSSFTNDDNIYIPWITKLNKHPGKKGVDSSILEVAFSEIALLTMKPGATSSACLVVAGKQQHVIGVASKNINQSIKTFIDNGEDCYVFDAVNWQYRPISLKVTCSDITQERHRMQSNSSSVDNLREQDLQQKIQLDRVSTGVNFLDKMPKDFFVLLMRNYKAGEILIDMELLASLLTSAYFLEEDDLHKGNIGFYVTEVAIDGVLKKKFNFFKIDHDLMFVDSIMSQKDARVANLLYDADSFKISLRDLDNFPDLEDSGNHYWPTRWRVLSAGEKAYNSRLERNAFASLKHEESFKAAKWKYFLKSALLPLNLIQKALVQHLNPVHDADKINMVKNAMWKRLAELRQSLVQSKAFANYLNIHGAKALRDIKNELTQYIHQTKISLPEQRALMRELINNFNVLTQCAKAENMPYIQQSIVLDSYRFSGLFNWSKPTAQDAQLAIERFDHYKKHDKAQAFKLVCIAQDLLSKVSTEELVKDIKRLEQFKDNYLAPHTVTSFKAFEVAAHKIRASNLPLKQQKNELLEVLKSSRLSVSELKKLKAQLTQKEPDSMAIKFIKQKRSELWIIRKLFGTYGNTATSSAMLKEIDRRLAIANKNQELKKKFQAQFKEFSEPPISSNKLT